MTLYPVYSNQKEANGLFLGASTFTGGEGGLVVRLKPHLAANVAGEQNFLEVDFIEDGSTDVSSHMFGLLEEQLTGRGTMLGRFMPMSGEPIPLGPSSHQAWGGGKVTLRQESGYFITDQFDLQLTSGVGDGYGEPATIKPGDLLYALKSDSATHKRGTLTDDATQATTRVRFMGMIDDSHDLFGHFVSPLPTHGSMKEGPFILIMQEA